MNTGVIYPSFGYTETSQSINSVNTGGLLTRSKHNQHIMYKIFHGEAVYKAELLQAYKATHEYMSYEIQEKRLGNHIISKYCRGCIHRSRKQYCRKGIDQTNNKQHCRFKRSTHGHN